MHITIGDDGFVINSRIVHENPDMTITLNGASRKVTAPLTIGDLLNEIGLAEKPVVVEHNRRALFPREIHSTPVTEGDVIEIVQVTAGG